MKLATSLIYTLFMSLALAGNEVGNGGDVIICPENIQLLDYFEAADHGFIINPIEGEYIQIASDYLKSFSKIDAKLAKQYQRRLGEIIGEIDFKPRVSLVDIPDSLNDSIPKNCKVEQIAIRRNLPVANKSFIINKDLWDKLSNQNKAGLILHEIIYEHFSYLGDKDSRKARFFNGFIAHDSAKKKMEKSYKSMLQEKEIPIYR